MSGLFYPQHILYVKTAELAFEDSFCDRNWSKAVEYGSLCLNSYKKYTIGNQVLLCFSKSYTTTLLSVLSHLYFL